MKTSYVVIGANFGDEAKGKIVDALTAQAQLEGKNPIVCRFNGGGQAGHTVIVGGKRHVFSHVASGALRNAPTYLSKSFIVNFFTLKKELTELANIEIIPRILINERANVTMLADMFVNGMIERKRNASRHGSCGLGINETVTRSLAENDRYALTTFDVKRAIFDVDGVEQLANKMFAICSEWLPIRLHQLGFEKSEIPDELYHITTLESLRAQATDIIDLVNKSVEITDDEYVRDNFEDIIFEGAQGLMLDEFLGFFPHVTRSMTGLPLAVEAAHALGVTHLTPIYLTRTYMTRHGAGPLSHEGEKFAEIMSVTDETNLENEWQGQLRFAPLNLALMKRFIAQDIRRGQLWGASFNVLVINPQIALSCLDQVEGYVCIYDSNSKFYEMPIQDLPDFIAEEMHLPVTITSDGPSAEYVYFGRRNTPVLD